MSYIIPRSNFLAHAIVPQASKMILSGEAIPAPEAERFGLVSKLSEPGKSLEDALALAQLVAQKSLSACLLAKEAIQKGEHPFGPGSFPKLPS